MTLKEGKVVRVTWGRGPPKENFQIVHHYTVLICLYSVHIVDRHVSFPLKNYFQQIYIKLVTLLPPP